MALVYGEYAGYAVKEFVQVQENELYAAYEPETWVQIIKEQFETTTTDPTTRGLFDIMKMYLMITDYEALTVLELSDFVDQWTKSQTRNEGRKA